MLDRLEHVGCQFLGHEPDPAARLAPVLREVVPERTHGAGGRAHQPAYRTDQGCLARTVWTQKGKDLTLADRKID